MRATDNFAISCCLISESFRLSGTILNTCFTEFTNQLTIERRLLPSPLGQSDVATPPTEGLKRRFPSTSGPESWFSVGVVEVGVFGDFREAIVWWLLQ